MANVVVLRTAGTNCDEETAWAFRLAGAEVETLHLSRLVAGERRLAEFDVLVLPGGFSYGDDLGAGTVFAGRLRRRLAEDIHEFVDSGRLVLGICNGFQVLVRLGILPGSDARGKAASLIENVSGRFEDRWVRLRVEPNACPFLAFAKEPGPVDRPLVLRAPVAHREGRFVTRDAEVLERLRAGGQIVLRYAGAESVEAAGGEYPANPNGSIDDIAGITNVRGNVLGLMPHPERFVHKLQDPIWTRNDPRLLRAETPEELARGGDGFPLFASAVRWVDRGEEAA